MPRTLLFVQAGHEVHVGAKPERTDLARIFIVFALRPLSLVLFLLAHRLKREAMEASCWAPSHPGWRAGG